MISMGEFFDKFSFKPELAKFIGIERERFLVSENDTIVPQAEWFLNAIKDPKWTYELSACQVEDRTSPQRSLVYLWRELRTNDRNAARILRAKKLRLCATEVAPTYMPLEIYPEPRYLEIAKRITREQLTAACRVAGVHIHVGMRNLEDAIHSFNRLRRFIPLLCKTGDNSHGERLRLYKTMAQNWNPPEIRDSEHFYELAQEQGFAENPRNCYWIMRISIHGTIELRMFGSADNLTILRHVLLVKIILSL